MMSCSASQQWTYSPINGPILSFLKASILCFTAYIDTPYGFPSSQIQYGYPSLHISRVVLDLEIFSHPKKPSFSLLTILYLTIEGRWPCLLKFITWVVLVVTLFLFLREEELEPPVYPLELDNPLGDLFLLLEVILLPSSLTVCINSCTWSRN